MLYSCRALCALLLIGTSACDRTPESPTPTPIPDAGEIESDDAGRPSEIDGGPPRQRDAGPAQCANGLHDRDDELDVDCGYTCEARCGLGSRCEAAEDCEAGLVCIRNGELEVLGRCRVQLENCLGDPCGAGEFCGASREYPDRRARLRGEMTLVTFCQPQATREREECFASHPADHDVQSCAPGLTCAAESPRFPGGCVPAILALGEDCEDGYRRCAEGLFCNNRNSSERRVCEPLRPAGADCSDASDCEHGLTCDDWSRTCVPRPGIGESCHPTREAACAIGLECVVDVLGACDSHFDCRGNCCLGPSGTECRPLGESCEPPVGTCM